MAKASGKAEAQTWQPPATQTASKENFAARPFPEIAKTEARQEASLDRAEVKENQSGGMIENINRSLAAASAPELPTLGLGGVQAKLTLGTVGDVYEQEADRVARQVVDEIHSSAFRASNTTSEGESVANGGDVGRVQRQITVQAAGDAGGEVSSEWEAQLQGAKSGGQPLSPSVREPMERAFGAGFGDVRVHTGAKADSLARSIQAKAFTTGQDVFFRQGAYEPGSRGGQELVAHELTHVVQQNGVTMQRMQKQDDEKEKLSKMQSENKINIAQRSVSKITYSVTPESSTIQRVAWHEKNIEGYGNLRVRQGVPNLVNVQNPNQQINFKVSGMQFNGQMYTVNPVTGTTKSEVIAKIAAQVGAVQPPSSKDFLKRSEIENMKILGSVRPVNDQTIPNSQHRNTYKNKIDPFLIKATGTYDVNNNIALYYQYGVDSYGYITRIEQEGQTYEMHDVRGQDALAKAQTESLIAAEIDNPLYSQFASAHDTEHPDELIADVASKSTTTQDAAIVDNEDVRTLLELPGDLQDKAHNLFVTDNLTRLKEKSKRLDAATKLAGEGARWVCVRNHAQHLKNSSKFYTAHPKDGSIYLYITFEKLWGVWGTKFSSKFDILNKEVSKMIVDNMVDANLIETTEKANMTNNDYRTYLTF